MSFFTSFCDLPQKEQLRFPLPALMSSRFRSMSPRYKAYPAVALLLHHGHHSDPAARARRPLLALGDVFLVGDDVVDEAVLLGLAGTHEVVALGVVANPVERL